VITTSLKGICRCGADVEREQAEGWGAHILNEAPFLCSTCEVAGVERYEAAERDRQHRLDLKRFESQLETIPAAFRDARLRELDTAGREKGLDAARRWAKGELLGLVLLGNIGVGKSTIAAAATADSMERHLDAPSPRWISTVLALSDLGRDFGDQQRANTIKTLTGKKSPLILDDLDKGKPSLGAAEHLFLAIDLATVNRRPLIVTTNLTPNELAAKWPKPHGDAIASRLAGYCEMHRITGPDRRLGMEMA
jgi:DNA replication protein DnaC